MEALSREQIEAFVRDGYIVLRGVFSREEAESIVRATFVERDPGAPLPELWVRTREGARRLEPQGVDLDRPITWRGATRIDLVTGHSLPIASFAPRQWGAIQALCGEGRPITRTTMGENWILNGDMMDGPAPAYDAAYTHQLVWHMDAPSERTTLDDSLEALVLLVLWSDIAPGGAGTMYSGASITEVVRALEDAPAGLDTRGRAWTCDAIARCGDVVEATGQIGDVIVAHRFMLHAAHWNFGDRVRVLENPTITVGSPFDYHTDNPHPCPVERVVIERLRRPRLGSTRSGSLLPSGTPTEDALASGPRAIGSLRWAETRTRGWVVSDPRAFLPEWERHASAAATATARQLDAELMRAWVRWEAARALDEQNDRFGATLSCVARVRHLLVSDPALKAPIEEPSFRSLVRGFVSAESQNALLALLLGQLYENARLFELRDPTTGRPMHVVVHVSSEDGWFFADASGPTAILHVSSMIASMGGPHPHAPDHADGSHPRQAYEHGALRPRLELTRTVTELTEPEPTEPERTEPGVGLTDAWSAYLVARVAHLWQGERAALPQYLRCSRAFRLGGTTKAVLDTLIDRASRA